jgi:hypothetical protein
MRIEWAAIATATGVVVLQAEWAMRCGEDEGMGQGTELGPGPVAAGTVRGAPRAERQGEAAARVAAEGKPLGGGAGRGRTGLLSDQDRFQSLPRFSDQTLCRPATIPLGAVEPPATQADRVERRGLAARLAGATRVTVAGPAEPHHDRSS